MKAIALAVSALLLASTSLKSADARPAPAKGEGIFDRGNLLAWCVVPFDAMKRGPEERARMLHRLGLSKFAYDWRAKDVPTFDAEVAALGQQGIELFAWWFPTAAEKPEARTILDVCQRHGIHPQLWVSGGGAPTPTPELHAQRLAQEVERIKKIVLLARPQGCTVHLYNHNGWFGNPDNQIAVIQRLREQGFNDVGMVYNFSHAHLDIADFPQIWKRIQPYVAVVNITGMVPDGEKKLMPPSQGDHELEMMRVIQLSGWRGPVGLIAEQGGDAEVTLSHGLQGTEWLRRELQQAGSGGPRPQFPSVAGQTK